MTALIAATIGATAPAGAQPIDESHTTAPIRLIAGDVTPAGSAPAELEGRFLVQFNRLVERADAENLAAEGAVVIGYVPDNAFVVRVPSGASVPDLAGISAVISHEPAWRISPDLSADESRIVRVQLDDDVDPDRVLGHLEAAGSDIMGVSDHSILALVDGPVPAALADHPAIAWIGAFRLPETHNESAGGIIGTTSAIAAGYDGSGQIVAVADTGLGDGTTTGAHADIPAGRIAAVRDWVGDNLAGCWTIEPDGAQDVDSGHGTHTAGSVLSDGAADGTGRGSAPGASLVFQATEDYVNFTTLCEITFGYEDGYYLLGLPDDLNELFQQAYDDGARIHSDSWGSDAQGEYDASAQDVDEFTWNHPDFLIVTSAGNSGVDGDADGYVDDDSTGSPATAKNVMTVGASEGSRSDGYPCEGTYDNSLGVSCTDQAGVNIIFQYGDAWEADYPQDPIASDASAGNAEQMAAFSSRGPTDDGRIKPDVVAPGTWILSTYSPLHQEGYGDPVNPANGLYQSDGWGFPPSDQYKYFGGTSMSAPLVSGAAALVRNYYDTEHGVDASAALTKATLINSAVDLLDENNDGFDDNDFPIPNIHEGWGRIDVEAAVDGSLAFIDGQALSTAQTHSYDLVPTSGPLKVTVVWSDAPALLESATALVNNLDVVLRAPNGTTTYRGNNFSGGWTVTGGSADTLNNVENVYLAAPTAGTWTVEITGTNVPDGPQPYALVVDGATFANVDTEAPTWPIGAALTAGTITDASIAASWPAAIDNVGVVAYDVSVDGVPTTSVGGTSATIGGLAPDTAYVISVNARDDMGNTSTAITGSFSTYAIGGGPPPDTTAPTWNGTGLRATEVLETTATITWPSATDSNGITGYDATVSSDAGVATTSVGPASLGIDLAKLAPATLYSVAVTARDPAGNDSAELSISFTTAIDFSDTNGHIFEADIAWLAAKGITAGCGDGTTFCPADSLTRGQMATLLVRAFDLPAVASGPFTDIGGVHAPNINALAAAGITSGCDITGTRFCPTENVTRAQMATFLVRAFGLDASNTDWFSDDGGSPHEAAINALAESGITLGCDKGRYCPSGPVNRGQIAAFLHRGFVLLDLD